MEENQFLNLISTHQGIILNVCHLYRDTASDREDLFQEVVFQLWRSIDGFKGNAKVSTFIYRVAINTAIASFRQEGKRSIVNYADQVPEPPPENENPLIAERKELLIAAIKTLEEADRAIMALVLDEYSYREIAEIIGITENHVGVRISRIKNRIKKLVI